MDMKTIASEQELGELVEASHERPVVLFKHSNSCPISAGAYGEMRRLLDERPEDDFDFAMVVVQTARALSDEVERRFGVRHETPQAIVLRNGRAVWNASHYRISREDVTKAMEES